MKKLIDFQFVADNFVASSKQKSNQQLTLHKKTPKFLASEKIPFQNFTMSYVIKSLFNSTDDIEIQNFDK